MKRLVAFVGIVMLAGAAPARAEETLVASAIRAAQQLARTTPPGAFAGRAAQAQQQPKGAGLEAEPGMSTRTKILIGIGAAAAFGAVIHAIDRGVVNNTPSSLGTRKD